MSVFTESVEKIVNFQNNSLNPVRKLTGVAVDTFEKVARQNYALYGDLLEFTVAQAKLPVSVVEPKELFERQSASTKEFTELLTGRVAEFVELGKEFRQAATGIVNEEIVAPVKKAANSRTKKAA